MTTTETKTIPLRYDELNDQLEMFGHREIGAEGPTDTLVLVVGELSIHRHPYAPGRMEQIHVMAWSEDETLGLHGWQKIAELGPPVKGGEEVAAGYVDLLAEWAGQPVGHVNWKNRIMTDNGLTPPERGSIDGLARRVIHAADQGDTGQADLAMFAVQLATAVLAAHEIHPDYQTALQAPRKRHAVNA